MGSGFEDETTADSVKPPSPLPGREDISILVLSGPSAGAYYKVAKDGGVIGREPDADIPILDPGVSRKHARIERVERARFVIRDLDSRYGVWVEGVRASEHAIRDGDRIQISGETVIRVRYQDAKETEILDRIQEAVIRDPLTGVFNRRHFLERLEQEYAFARRHGTPVSVLMIDIDHFKKINDTHGHPVGDSVLAAVGRLLLGAVRVEDVIARYGGDELVIISRAYDANDSQLFAERLVKMIREKPIRVGSLEFPLTMSVGIATYQGADPDSQMTLVARADAALYRAKMLGRDRIAVWSSTLTRT
jgi:two-component system, cell cycle response regulator